jgi:tetratricopeptide (TPR) repeat protein/CHAT domain-containing protein
MGDYREAEHLYEQSLSIQRAILGDLHPDVATSLHNLAVLYEAMGEPARAESLYQQALAVQRRVLGEQHPDVATTLSNLAELYRTMGNYAQAEPLFQQALAIRRAALGERHPDVAASLSGLGNLYHTLGDYAQAEPLFRQALAIQRSVLGDAHPDLAETLSSLAGLYRSTGTYTQAESHYQEALAIQRAVFGEVHPDVATTLNQLAGLYRAMGDYVQAETLYQQALATQRTLLGEQHPAIATSLNNLAVLYAGTGNYAQAESLSRQALAMRRAVFGEVHPEVAASLNNLAALYASMGDYAQAEPLYRQAVEIWRASVGEGHPNVATSLSNLAGLHEAMGDYVQAELLYRQALAIQRATLGETHPDVATSLNNLAVLYCTMSDYAQAELQFRQVLEMLRTFWGEGHPDVATALSNLAVLYYSMGGYAQAESLFQQVLATRRTVLGEIHPDVAISLSNLVMLYYSMGDYIQAESLCQQALAIQRTLLGDRHPDVANSLNSLAGLRVVTDRLTEALTLSEQVATIDDRVVEQVFSIGSERQRMALLVSLQGDMHGFLSLVLQHLPHLRAARQKALDLVLRRKAIGAEVLAAQRDAILGGRYPHLAPQLQELTALRMQIAQKTLAGPDSTDIEAHRQLLVKWNAQKERLEADLARQIPEMTLGHQLQTANRQAVAEALPQEAALVEFVRFGVFDFRALPARGEKRWRPAHYVAFILMADEPERVEMIDLGEADPIEQLIATFLTSLTSGAEHLRHLRAKRPMSEQALHASTGRALRTMLLDPLLKSLRGRKRLFLAPDGDLMRLPFEVLPTDGQRHVIDDYQISYLSTGRDVLRFDSMSPGRATSSLVVADPDFDLSESDEPTRTHVSTPHGRRSRGLNRGALRFERLPGTRVEGQRISNLLGVEALLDRAALEATLKASRSPRILHIATHGFFLPDQPHIPGKEGARVQVLGGPTMGRLERFLEQEGENPLLRSGLALAGANTWNRGGLLPPEAEDGLLTAEDVSGLDLLETELVVLSACETGLGKIHVGEGIFGLRRAFVLAGARTLVMSLWKVPDQQTRELMEHFYHGILAGQPSVDALRKAQLAMKATYQDPYYWGAFICQGDPNPVPHGT